MSSTPFALHVAPQHISRTARLAAFLILILVLAGSTTHAQKHQRLPDSLPATQEDLPPPPVTDTVAVEKNDLVYPATGTTDTTKTKDADTAETMQLRTIPDSTIHRLKNEKAFAYANDPSFWKEEPEKSNDHSWLLWLARLLTSKGFRYFIYIFLGGVLLYALYRIIADNNLRMFYRQPKKIRVAGEEAAGLQEDDLDEKLRQAILDKDYRSAVRFLYLTTLRKLENDGAIRYHMQATGQDYINQLSGHPQLALFRYLHSIYERVWYGEVPVDGDQFAKLQGYFNQFNLSTSPSV